MPPSGWLCRRTEEIQVGFIEHCRCSLYYQGCEYEWKYKEVWRVMELFCILILVECMNVYLC